MRRLALAAAAALAACSVELEGAPCTTDQNCPGEQRCDLGAQKCVACAPDPFCTGDGFACAGTSVRECRTTVGGCRYSEVTPCQSPLACGGTFPSATCRCPQVDTVLGKQCTGEGTRTCDRLSGVILVCAGQGSCLVWEAAPGGDCASQGLVCSEPTAGQPVCVCDAYSGTDLYADAVSGRPASDAVRPTGAQEPAICRFRALADALGAASAGDTVRMTGWTAAEVKFSAAATGESYPLAVAPGVTLTTTDPSPVPAHYVIEVDQAGATRPVLQLDHDAVASGFTIRPGNGGTASQAVRVNCSAAGSSPVSITSLILDGKGALAASAIDEGLRLSGPCGVSVDSLVVRNAARAGIQVLSSTSASSVSIANSSMRGNGDGGLVVNLDASMGAPSLSVTGNDIAGNGATTAYTVATVTRRGGGVVLQSAAPSPFVFTGNSIHGNSFDQVLVYSSNAWNLAAGACGAASNTFTCYDGASPSGPWVGLGAIGGGTVSAANDYWANAVPSSGKDYFQAAGSTVVFTPSCGASVPTCP